MLKRWLKRCLLHRHFPRYTQFEAADEQSSLKTLLRHSWLRLIDCALPFCV